METHKREELRALAEKNDIDLDQLLTALEADALPDDVRDTIATILGDITLFGHALDSLDT
ncbi:hypothetical protein GO013_05265 [Pseudodesulfovibrio sp. JC047]|uniref:hypothetical protein n=1 Tax=Pseudodesulfovibrio sp. JC047 TaxID=2683199 RepID=UPI0013D221D4|nr:hypothetical protein [Pseudodesulfovibrio sp. JC047]NDV18828.1 hypothetical protein [Pseudodesulfovibrio sp. JC047]